MHRPVGERDSSTDHFLGTANSCGGIELRRTALGSAVHFRAPIDLPNGGHRTRRKSSTSLGHSLSLTSKTPYPEGESTVRTPTLSRAQPSTDYEMDIESQDTTRQRRAAFLGDSKSSGDLRKAEKKAQRSGASASWLKRHEQSFTAMSQLKATLLSSWIMVFLIPAVPAGIVVKYTNQSPVTTFAVNFIAIIPLSKILDAVTEELGIRWGGHEGLFVIVTFGYEQYISASFCTTDLLSAMVYNWSLLSLLQSNTNQRLYRHDWLDLSYRTWYSWWALASSLEVSNARNKISIEPRLKTSWIHSISA